MAPSGPCIRRRLLSLARPGAGHQHAGREREERRAGGRQALVRDVRVGAAVLGRVGWHCRRAQGAVRGSPGSVCEHLRKGGGRRIAMRQAVFGNCLCHIWLLRAVQRAVRDLLGCEQSLMAACISSGPAQVQGLPKQCAQHIRCRDARIGLGCPARHMPHPYICLLYGSCAACGC